MPSAALERLTIPIVLAPMAGGPTTPQLAAAVSNAGGLGFLAAGYLSPERLAQEIERTRALTDHFGVGVFAGGGSAAEPELVEAYATRLRAEAARAGVELGTPHHDDDSLDAKLALLVADPVPVVSFTFGVPSAAAIESLQAAGTEVWLTVTSPPEAGAAAAAGADALVVQGVEAGGHRGIFTDDTDASELTLLAALQLIAAANIGLPLIGAGSVMTGAGLAAVLAAGAHAAQLGTAYLLADEAGTSPAQRTATTTATRTVLTRAFSGRTARGIENRLHREHGATAPAAYPEVHHLTSPLRAQARKTGDADLINLWAGQAHELAQALPADEITRRLAADARAALAAAAGRVPG